MIFGQKIFVITKKSMKIIGFRKENPVKVVHIGHDVQKDEKDGEGEDSFVKFVRMTRADVKKPLNITRKDVTSRENCRYSTIKDPNEEDA